MALVKATRAPDIRAVLFAFAAASIPVWPSFITLAALSPPGVSIIPPALAIADLVLCVLAACAATLLLLRERAAVPPLLAPIGVYVGCWVLASLLGLDPLTGLLMTAGPALGSVFYAAIASWYTRPHVARALYTTFLGTGVLVSLLGIVLVLLRRPAALYVLVHGRATATFVVPGEFAGYLLLLIAAALGIALVTTSGWLRLLAVAAALCGTVALVLTYSRAGWLGAVVGSAFFLYTATARAGRGRRRFGLFAAFLGFALAMGIGAIVLYEGHHNPSEDYARLSIWRAGLRAIELFPLTGVGPGAFRHVYPLLRPLSGEPFAFHVHNQLLTAFAETGIVGLCALLFLWWRFIGVLLTALREAAPRNRLLALALASGLLATWVQGLLDFVQILVLGCWLPFMALTIAAAQAGFPEP
ncbi:MAG TPA: O-antigen ligase family protein [Candidatus Acidoferrales bacterium]|nr:O-antigen ligase family protein [Candidatus Acidoferrales bacterium]